MKNAIPKSMHMTHTVAPEESPVTHDSHTDDDGWFDLQNVDDLEITAKSVDALGLTESINIDLEVRTHRAAPERDASTENSTLNQANQNILVYSNVTRSAQARLLISGVNTVGKEVHVYVFAKS